MCLGASVWLICVLLGSTYGVFVARPVKAEDRSRGVVVVETGPRGRRPGSAHSTLRRPRAHPYYAVELEGHLQLQWTNVPLRSDVGPGVGFRASIPVIQQGPISGINNNLAISFGVDWAHFWACRPGPECGANDIWFPIVMQWNFFVTPAWSFFPEVGLAIHHSFWSYDEYGPIDPGPRGCGPGPRDICAYADNRTALAFATWLGARWSPSDVFSIVFRLGVPSLTAGMSLRI
jgi:hypothetical protein